jgi:membrane protease subunit HflK
MQVDEVLTSGKALVQNTARSEAQGMLDRYNAGVSLLAVSLQSVNPPGEAVSAFHAVSDAKAQAAQAINEAEGNREQMLSNARGMASKAVQEASAQADARVQRARGATERFAQVLARAKRTPEQTRTELYLSTIREVLPRARIVLLAPGAPPGIDLNFIEKRRPDDARR